MEDVGLGTGKTIAQLERDDVVRGVLEQAAKAIESQTYESEAYQKALKTAARVVRSLKP